MNKFTKILIGTLILLVATMLWASNRSPNGLLSSARSLIFEASTPKLENMKIEGDESASSSFGHTQANKSPFEAVVESDPTAFIAPSWFEEPQFESQNLLSKTPEKEVKFGHSCTRAQRKFQTLGAYILNNFGFSAQDLFPKNARVVQLTQFWKLGVRYFQTSAILSRGPNAEYVLSQYESTNPDLLADLKRIPISNYVEGSSLKLDDAMSVIESNLKAQPQHETKLGSRIMEVELIASEREELATASFLNALPIAFLDNETACKVDGELGKMLCECKSKSERNP